MPRANRHFVPGYVWHITHRCHQQAFLLKFVRDRDRYLHWLFEAKKRFGLCVLNYIVTCNHVHLLVLDTGNQVIGRSMQLIAGRSGQEYNARKNRRGAFWEDRYHATAVENDGHLHRCLVYIDLNMVRAGVVSHPAQWAHAGYVEIQSPPERYSIISTAKLASLCGFGNFEAFQQAHREWVQSGLEHGSMQRDERWSAAVAVGSPDFVDRMRAELGPSALRRTITGVDDTFVLREPKHRYGTELDPETGLLRPENTLAWKQRFDTSGP
jgi:REP element-mobilizing transposase RayT